MKKLLFLCYFTVNFAAQKQITNEPEFVVYLGDNAAKSNTFGRTGTFIMALELCKQCVKENYYKRDEKDLCFKKFVLKNLNEIITTFKCDRIVKLDPDRQDYYKASIKSLFTLSQKKYNELYGEPVALCDLFPIAPDSVFQDIDFQTPR